MDNDDSKTSSSLKRPAQPARARRTKKKKNAKKKEDGSPGATNDGLSGGTPQATKEKKPPRGRQYLDDRETPCREVVGLMNHSHVGITRGIRSPREGTKTENRKKQEEALAVLKASFCLSQADADKFKTDLKPIVQENMDKEFVRVYADWRDNEPWCLMAHGRGIEPLRDGETSFHTIASVDRIKNYIKYFMDKPKERNCNSTFCDKCRMRTCACHGTMQDGMEVHHEQLFTTNESGLVSFQFDASLISQHVVHYFHSRIAFLVACHNLMDPNPRFTDRQIYRYLRQKALVFSTFEKVVFLFRGDMTKRHVLPLMTPVCPSNLLEPLGTLDKLCNFVQQPIEATAQTATEKKATEERVKLNKDTIKGQTKHLNMHTGLRTNMAFFAAKGSRGHPYPGAPQRRGDKKYLIVTSCESTALEESGWVTADVADRLQILSDDDRIDGTLNGGLLHRIDFNHRLSLVCLGGMVFQSHFLTKLQYNLVDSTDTPPLDVAYRNLQALYGPVMSFGRYCDEYNKATGSLMSAGSVREHQVIPASGSLVYSHPEVVTNGHGFRHSIVILDEDRKERRDGISEQVALEKEMFRKDHMARYKAAVNKYHKEVKEKDPVANIRDLYKMKLPLLPWDDSFKRFTYVTGGVKYNRVKHTVIALHGLPCYFHDTDFGTHDSDYCAFPIPISLQLLLPQIHEHLLNSNGYEIQAMITAGMLRINGNDNLFSFPDFETCQDLFTRFGNCVPADEVGNLVADVVTAIRSGCEIALNRKMDGSLNSTNCSIRMRLQCNVPDLTKTTMECKRTAYPLQNLHNAAKEGVTVLSGILPLHDSGLLQQAYNGEMKTSTVKAGTRFHRDVPGYKAFRGLPVFISPDSFVLYPASLPVAFGMAIDPGISYYLELDVQISRQTEAPSFPLTTLGERGGLDCYLTSGGPAMSFFTDEAIVQQVKQTLDVANRHPEETSFSITKDLVLPSVVYWSKHGKETDLRKALRDQVEPTLETLGRHIWFGNFEHLNKVRKERMGECSSSNQQMQQTGQPTLAAMEQQYQQLPPPAAATPTQESLPSDSIDSSRDDENQQH